MRSSAWRFLPAIIWTGFIIYSLVSESSGLPKFEWLQFQHSDKLIHAVLFFVESVLIAASFRFKIQPKEILGIVGWCMVLGGALEVVQSMWVHSRTGDLMDLIADIAGALVGIALVKTIFK